jgi:putative sterol carrier protein
MTLAGTRAPRHPIIDRKARWLSRWVADASDERLARTMRSPLRRILIWQIFRTMGQRFDAERAGDLDAVVEFQVRDGRDGRTDRRQVTIADGRCTTSARAMGTPTLTIALGPVAFLKLVSGATGPRRLMLTGRLRVRGDLILAMRLPDVLGIPSRPAPRR